MTVDDFVDVCMQFQRLSRCYFWELFGCCPVIRLMLLLLHLYFQQRI